MKISVKIFCSVNLIILLCNVGQTNNPTIINKTMNAIRLTDENTIKMLLLILITIVCLYYLNSFYKWVKNSLRNKAIQFFNIKY